MIQTRRKQSGSTLLISLVLLVMLTLFVLTVINTTNVNTRIAGNMQMMTEAQTAAQHGIEKVISVNFPANPALADETVMVDIGNNKTYSVLVKKPVCISVVPIKDAELDPVANPSDAACKGSGVITSGGIIGPGGPGGATDSYCSNSRWNVQGEVKETATTGLNVVVHQGVAVRVPIGTPCPS